MSPPGFHWLAERLAVTCRSMMMSRSCWMAWIDLGLRDVRCDAAVCNPAISAPGPFRGFSAVGWLKHLNISMQCRGNGVDWQSGNTLRISDSVIQGYPQYGVRGGIRRGGYGGFEMENVYQEVGNCTNPMGKMGKRERWLKAEESGLWVAKRHWETSRNFRTRGRPITGTTSLPVMRSMVPRIHSMPDAP